MTEQTITIPDGNGNNPRTLTRKDWQTLKDMGMLWEHHPGAPYVWPHPEGPTLIPSISATPAPRNELAQLKVDKANLLLETIQLRQFLTRISRANHMSTVDAILAEWHTDNP